MHDRRYTILIADRASGVLRRATISLRVAVGVVGTVLALPMLMGLGAKWSARGEIEQLRSNNAQLLEENSSYRAATGQLTAQIQSLEGVIDDLGVRATIDPAQARAIQKLPAIIKSKASGGSAPAAGSTMASVVSSLSTPEDTFGVLRDLLQGLESRLTYVRRDVERRQALAASTPSIWPA